MNIRQHPIRQHCLASVSALTLLLGLPLGAQEIFSLKWQASGITKKIGGHRPHPIMLAATAPDSIKKTPPGLTAPLYGSFAMGPAKAATTIGVILDLTADKQQRLFVDANGNGDFTDDPACPWAHPAKVGDTGAEELTWEGAAMVAIPFADGVRNGRVNFYTAQTGPDGKLLQPVIFHYSDFGWVGEIKIDGKAIPAVLEDGGGAADLHLTGGLMETPLLWLDLPGKARTVVPSRPFDVDGKWWTMANLTADGAFEIKPAAKPAGAAKPTGPNDGIRGAKLAPAIEKALAMVAGKAIDTAPPAAAPGQVLKVGDPAPKLCPGKWLQGEPVAEFAPGTVYVVEFWATWCGPCKASIPHLNELHLKFKDQGLVVIGQDCWERNDAAVEPFVRNMATKMTYRVAADDTSDGGKGNMANAWMAAAGRNAIPAAFIVGKQGKIVWIGHPMKLDETMLGEILGANHSQPLSPGWK
jgi:thiol-disulfide isomerase/thioredoxin